MELRDIELVRIDNELLWKLKDAYLGLLKRVSYSRPDLPLREQVDIFIQQCKLFKGN